MSEVQLLADLPLWERHEARVMNILRDALGQLAEQGRPVGGEGDISRELYLCILDVNRKNKGANDNWFDYPPMYEARNPPSDTTDGESYENKIPDLQWAYIDHQEPNSRRSARHFVVECKRLGLPSNSGWAFNLHYVEDGVMRFIDPSHKYGFRSPAGSMIGYVESMSVEAVAAEVNAFLADRKLDLLEPIAQPEPLHVSEHCFERTFDDSPFKLIHLWVELPLA